MRDGVLLDPEALGLVDGRHGGHRRGPVVVGRLALREPDQGADEVTGHGFIVAEVGPASQDHRKGQRRTSQTPMIPGVRPRRSQGLSGDLRWIARPAATAATPTPAAITFRPMRAPVRVSSRK